MFAIFYDKQLLVILKDIPKVRPLPTEILNWYSKNYAFERTRLSWAWVNYIDCQEMKYEDFK